MNKEIIKELAKIGIFVSVKVLAIYGIEKAILRSIEKQNIENATKRLDSMVIDLYGKENQEC